MMTNQCDWQSNVDCRFNKNPSLLSSTQSDYQVDPQVSYQTIKQLSLQTLDKVVHNEIHTQLQNKNGKIINNHLGRYSLKTLYSDP